MAVWEAKEEQLWTTKGGEGRGGRQRRRGREERSRGVPDATRASNL
jgi:hypothetical protein